MGKYIDRAALFNSLTNAKTVAEVFAAIQDAPAADVQEVRHGKWEYRQAYKGANFGFYTCSVCGVAKWTADTKYCANCGATMKGPNENE